jgi:hypothetical protein
VISSNMTAPFVASTGHAPSAGAALFALFVAVGKKEADAPRHSVAEK